MHELVCSQRCAWLRRSKKSINAASFVCMSILYGVICIRENKKCVRTETCTHTVCTVYHIYIYIFACIFTIICVLPLCIPIYCTYSILYRYIHLHMYIQLLISICTYIQYIYTHSLLQTFLLHSYFLDIHIQYITCCISTVNMYLH